MKQYKLIGTILFIASTIIGCNNVGSGGNIQSDTKTIQQSNLKSNDNVEDGFFALRMGSGFDTSSNTATSGQSCLVASADQNNITITNPTALINFEQSQDLSTLEKNLDVNVSGSYGGDRFSMSMAAQFATLSKNDAYTTNIIYLYKYAGLATFKNGSLKQGDDALTEVAKSFVHGENVKFRTMCGDSFVEQMDAGAMLGVRLTLSFNSHIDQEKFNAALDAKLGLADITAAIKQASNQQNVHVSFSLSAIQLGGEPQKLNDVFGSKGGSGNYPFIDCGDIDNQDKNSCNKMTSNIIEYAQTLKEQLSHANGSINLDNLYYSNAIISKYDSLGIHTGAPNPTPEILKAMETLTANYDKTMYDYKFAKHYITKLADKLDTPTKNSLEDATNTLAKQLNNVYLAPVYGALNCYKGYVSESCVAIQTNIDNALKQYKLKDPQPELLDYLENNSYSAGLYAYIPESRTEPSDKDYQKTQCILVPVSAPSFAQYAINCSGSGWLLLTNKLKIITNIGDTALYISGLSYTDGRHNHLISYPANIMLPKDSFYENFYFDGNIDYIYGESATKSNTDLGVTRLYENKG